MKLINESGDAVHLPWDAAQAALASGAYEAHEREGERGPDQPAAQSPAPGVDPVGGKEEQTEGNQPSNIAPLVDLGATAPGLPKEPSPVPEKVTTAAQVAPAPVLKPVAPISPVKTEK